MHETHQSRNTSSTTPSTFFFPTRPHRTLHPNGLGPVPSTQRIITCDWGLVHISSSFTVHPGRYQGVSSLFHTPLSVLPPSSRSSPSRSTLPVKIVECRLRDDPLLPPVLASISSHTHTTPCRRPWSRAGPCYFLLGHRPVQTLHRSPSLTPVPPTRSPATPGPAPTFSRDRNLLVECVELESSPSPPSRPFPGVP